MTKKEVYVLRGIPGSGKSTWANARVSEEMAKGRKATSISADRFNYDACGYWINPKTHSLCLKAFMKVIQEGYDVIVVDDTNIRLVEAAPYMALAIAHGYNSTLMNFMPFAIDVDKIGKRNIHGVSPETVRNMFYRMQKEDLGIPWWNTEYIYVKV
jgi:predicted kinase